MDEVWDAAMVAKKDFYLVGRMVGMLAFEMVVLLVGELVGRLVDELAVLMAVQLVVEKVEKSVGRSTEILYILPFWYCIYLN